MRDLENLRRRAIDLGDECPHYPPAIYFADGTQEAEQISHNCGKRRLRIHLSYVSHPCKRALLDAADCVRETLRADSGLPMELVIGWASQDFSVDPVQLTAAFSENA